MAISPVAGARRWTRQRKSCARSSGVGTPKLVTVTPRAFRAPPTCLTAPSFPAASRPWDHQDGVRASAPEQILQLEQLGVQRFEPLLRVPLRDLARRLL